MSKEYRYNNAILMMIINIILKKVKLKNFMHNMYIYILLNNFDANHKYVYILTLF